MKVDRGLRALAVAATGGLGWATASTAGVGGAADRTLVSTVGSGCSHLRRRVPNCTSMFVSPEFENPSCRWRRISVLACASSTSSAIVVQRQVMMAAIGHI